MFGSDNIKSFRVERLSNGYNVSILTGNMFKEPEKQIAKDQDAVIDIIRKNMP